MKNAFVDLYCGKKRENAFKIVAINIMKQINKKDNKGQKKTSAKVFLGIAYLLIYIQNYGKNYSCTSVNTQYYTSFKKLN